jgi:hypothetical protein
MARNIEDRIANLRARRFGLDRLSRLNEAARSEVVFDSLSDEPWQTRAAGAGKPFTKYALGAMQEVGKRYTEISVETATRVGKQLETGLANKGYSVDFRLQGSVPLNVHIRGVSDVDLLTLDTSFYTYTKSGLRSQLGYYTSPTQRTSLGVILELRAAAVPVLRDAFPAADVDNAGGKAICISGGSLARSIDVVPSHWFDNATYQQSGQEFDRSVTIADKKVPETIDNLPFLHIKKVHEADLQTHGGMKKAIRLCKNVKADADSEIALPSFDIAAMMFHADRTALTANQWYELSVLAETQRFVDLLTLNETYAQTLMVPDGSRPIFNTRAKLDALRKLSIELDDLTLQVAREQDVLGRPVPNLGTGRQRLKDVLIPAL